jgi:cardiolipin synthase
MTAEIIALLSVLVHVALQVSFVVRAILRPHREASSRAAWVLVLLTLPIVGMIAYVLFGETNIGQKRLEKYREVADLTAGQIAHALREGRFEAVEEPYRHLFRLGQSVNGLGPLPGNAGEVLADTNSAFDALVADIDAARDTVHLMFYIWLGDSNGRRVAEAAIRAARRGITVRVMADDIGSRAFVRSDTWREMEKAGVKVAAALPVRHPLLHPIRGRVDLRNHRKIVVVDNAIAYAGSANCADPEFRIKARYAPWVDIMMRFEGPVAVQMQYIFIQDWMTHTDENLIPLIRDVQLPPGNTGAVAQVIGTGPTIRPSAMPEMFEVLIHAARKDLVISTPYYVPSDSMHDAVCSAARRGVRTSLIVPEKNDSWIVAAASRSYYPELVHAGVRIFEFPNGLLHAKILTLDGEVSLIGSANLDRRSFELNYENNVLLEDAELTSRLVERQEDYLAVSRPIDAATIAGWTKRQRLWHNAVAMMGPVL